MSERKRPTSIENSQDPENIHNLHDEGEESAGSGTVGGGSEQQGWKIPLAAPSRDDLLSPQEKKRLLQVHEFANKILIDKQKHKIEDRKRMKAGERPVQQQGQSKGLGSGKGGSQSHYKEHPIAKKFSGKIDEQLSPLANENKADTNAELKQELQNKLENRLQNQYRNTPKFNPRPRPG